MYYVLPRSWKNTHTYFENDNRNKSEDFRKQNIYRCVSYEGFYFEKLRINPTLTKYHTALNWRHWRQSYILRVRCIFLTCYIFQTVCYFFLIFCKNMLDILQFTLIYFSLWHIEWYNNYNKSPRYFGSTLVYGSK